MRTELVEIYSDATNAAILRHPERRFPGVLLQGDTLHEMLRKATRIKEVAANLLPENEQYELADLHEHLVELVGHYKRTLADHHLPLPFAE